MSDRTPTSNQSRPDTTPFALVDTHVHFWDRNVEGLRWAWLEPGFTHPRLGRLPEIAADRYVVEDYRRAIGDCDVNQIVHIQAAQSSDPVIETAWLQQLSDAQGWPDAVVGYAPLADSTAADIVRRHLEFPILRGVRDLPAGEHLDDPAVIRGFNAIAALGVSIEVMTSWPNYAHVHALAQANPDVTIILGHAGLPVERDPDYFAQWHPAIVALGWEPNIVCKISALASGADPGWTVESIRPWVLGCLEAFGPNRCMFGSNWPIDSLFGDYARLVGAYRDITAELSDDEQAAVFTQTARRVYRLE
jgi:predicted TIM-barrel fold metal-dependent hydrolase